MRVARGDDRTRLGSGHTPRSKTVPLELKLLNSQVELGGGVASGVHTPEIDRQMEAALARLERLQGRKLGAAKRPLLVSVRSGAMF